MVQRSLSAAMASVELVPVGAGYCLFHPGNHAMGLLNEAAAKVWRDYCAGTQDLAVAELPWLVHWREAGLISELPMEDAPAHELDSASPRGFMVGDKTLSEQLAAVLAPIAAAVSQTDICVNGPDPTDGRYEIFRNGQLAGIANNRSEARRIALLATIISLHRPGSVTAVLHASAIAIDGKVVLLAGSTGSGKSTLMAALVASGAQYVADDFAALGSDGLSIGTFPIAASIKSGSWEIVGQSFPDLTNLPVFDFGSRRVRFVELGGTPNRVLEFLPVTALIFPEYDRNSAVSSCQCAPEDTLARLIASGTEIVGEPRSVQPLSTLVNSITSLSLRFSTLDEACAHITALAKGRF